MKGTFTFIIIIFISGIAFGQSFEGEIIYHNTYKTKLNNVTDREWNDNMGTMEEYIINDSNYRATTNGLLFEWQLYNNKDNKIYTKMSNSEYIYWNDGSVDEDSVLKVEVNKSDTEILGYKCDELILTCSTGTQKFYFNSKLYINARCFAKHKFGNWFEYLDIANAVPLETIIDTEQFTMVSTAIEIKSIRINNKEFKLPEGAKTVKSPY
jgi:hypothetical protein